MKNYCEVCGKELSKEIKEELKIEELEEIISNIDGKNKTEAYKKKADFYDLFGKVEFCYNCDIKRFNFNSDNLTGEKKTMTTS